MESYIFIRLMQLVRQSGFRGGRNGNSGAHLGSEKGKLLKLYWGLHSASAFRLHFLHLSRNLTFYQTPAYEF